jgi:hypothetical protein
MSPQPDDAPTQRFRWPWVALGLGLCWTVLIRVPLVLNAHDHLDSDLAVDGLTLLDAVNGHWRWHYPGTPYMGILPMLPSYPQAVIWGANPVTLVSGGTIIWSLVVLSTFWLAARAYGLEAAGWAIAPLVFSSLGTIWLSGRITGGHLLTLVWHNVAFVGFFDCLTRATRWRVVLLGIWCGLGIFVDAMFLLTLAGMGAAACLAWRSARFPRTAIAPTALFLCAILVGLLPRPIGTRVDPYNAYPSQFGTTLEPAALLEHARLLGLHCLPRLIAGIELNEIERAGTAITTWTGGLAAARGASPRLSLPPSSEWLAVLLLLTFGAAFWRLGSDPAKGAGPARIAVSRGTLGSALLIIPAFLVNLHIYDSDSYRYLILVLTPWSLGFGLLMTDLSGRGWIGRLSAPAVAGFLSVMMTAASFLWYRDDRGYVNQMAIPVKRAAPHWSELTVVADGPRGAPAVSSRFRVAGDVSHVFGGYWDVYRMSFLSGDQIKGIPFPIYPNRFRGWSRGLGPDEGKLLILLPEGAARKPKTTRSAEHGSDVVGSAKNINWLQALRTSWEVEGRDPAELGRLQVIVP